MMKVRFSPVYVTMAAFAVIVASVALAPSLVLAAEPANQEAVSTEPLDTTATYGNWVLHCTRLPSSKTGEKAENSPKSCEIVQSVQVQGQPRPVMQMAIGRLPGQKDFMITTVLPTDVSIPGRVHISIDGQADDKEKAGFDLALTRCMPEGCVAGAKLDAKMRARMESGKDGQLRFVRADEKVLGIPLSWIGFSQAMKALDQEG